MKQVLELLFKADGLCNALCTGASDHSLFFNLYDVVLVILVVRRCDHLFIFL